MTSSALLGLRCARCNSEFEPGPYFEGCPACRDGEWAANLEVVYDLEMAKRSWGISQQRGVWRYAPMLPLRKPECRVTLGEGATPLVPIPAPKQLRKVWLKNESLNPTWSYKDRMCTVGVSMAVERGSSVVGISSTSNQGASGSAYAARAGLNSVVLTLEEIEDPTLAFMQAYGALLLRTSRVGRREVLRHGVEELGWYPISSYTAVPTGNPFAAEGYKTIAYEIFEDLGSAPEAVIVPTALGEGLAGIFAGFRDLNQMGFIERVPRMVAAEPAGGAPISKTILAGAERVLAVDPYSSIAMTLAATMASDRSLLAVRESGGCAIPVTDNELRDAQTFLRSVGLLAEPAGCAAIAALVHVMEALPDLDPETGRVVAVMTGSGLRELPTLRNSLPTVETLGPGLAQFDSIWENWLATRP